VSPARRELSFCISEDDILHRHSREHLTSYITQLATIRGRNTRAMQSHESCGFGKSAEENEHYKVVSNEL
jgi:hypothetical protein